MSQLSESTLGGRKQGKETGLPLVQCPYCGKATVFERRSTKTNENHGRVYFKCPRGVGWSAEKCAYYRWQKEYLDDLIAAKVTKVFDHERDHEIEAEDQSSDLQHVLFAPEAVGGKEKKKEDVEAKLDKILKLVCVLFVLVVAIIGMFVGNALK